MILRIEVIVAVFLLGSLVYEEQTHSQGQIELAAYVASYDHHLVGFRNEYL